MDSCYSVYIHTNKINNKRYIGLTKQDPEKRWRNGNNYLHSPHFKRAIEKYGWDNFEHEIYSSSLTAEQASALEKELIKKFNTTNENYGYNLDAGGFYTQHSESTKDKIRQRITGIKRSEETKERLRKASTGNKNCVGRKQTEESKRKNREAHLNKTHLVTEEAKLKMRRNHPKCKEIVCVELGMIFPSICEAARFVSGSQGTISSVLTGTRKTAYGYHWEYKQ